MTPNIIGTSNNDLLIGDIFDDYILGLARWRRYD
jgi:hypothetical protein